ncbi:DUF1289 domain-containing protein [uncultured Tateyamaria sp.]|uniref:DUF1289 domain-containing protein n=1 Tax=uncultured Tateyamaria sp. TaxID=455651 RepID=UPI002611AAAF|nr:DUF1289 domain-containing protein [uncultured Tateyamaria sp.]
MAKKLPSPCVDVCKYKRQDHCIACSMTKAQKSMFKALKSNKHREAFVDMLVAQQLNMGRFKAWPGLYEQRCAKKGAPVPKIVSAQMR